MFHNMLFHWLTFPHPRKKITILPRLLRRLLKTFIFSTLLVPIRGSADAVSSYFNFNISLKLISKHISFLLFVLEREGENAREWARVAEGKRERES